MNRIPSLKPTLVLAALLLAGQALHAQHGHLNAGAAGQGQNDALVWDNGAAFAAGSGYVQNMALATNPASRYFGLFNSGPTLTALSMTNLTGPAAGAFLTAEIVSLTGPAGALFSFWEGEDQGGGATPTFSIATGGAGLSHRFALSDASLGAGMSGQDPFGHLHGRRFTTSTEGLYTLGLRVLDTSMNGAGGGPIHLPSEVLYINFATVPEPSAAALVALGVAGVWWLRRRRNA
jgi:hypothetical protein